MSREGNTERKRMFFATVSGKYIYVHIRILEDTCAYSNPSYTYYRLITTLLPQACKENTYVINVRTGTVNERKP